MNNEKEIVKITKQNNLIMEELEKEFYKNFTTMSWNNRLMNRAYPEELWNWIKEHFIPLKIIEVIKKMEVTDTTNIDNLDNESKL